MARKRYKINYCLGTCFAVPLRGGGYARGVVARMSGNGGVFGYFFGPKIDSEKDLSIDENWKARDAVLAQRFGDLGLVENEWKTLGTLPGFKPEDWPMPEFVRYNDDGSMAFISRYDDETLDFVRERKVPAAEACDPSLLPDGVAGFGAVELRLTALLGKGNAKPKKQGQ